MNNIKHIFFDLDHTLWDFDRNSEFAFKVIFQKHKISVPLPEFFKAYKPINLGYWKLYQENKISKIDLRRKRFSDTFTACNQKISLDVIDLLAEDYITHLPDNNYLIKGSVELLDYLKSKYKLHIITNGFREIQNKKLKKSGIYSYFDSVTNSEDAGVKKPHPGIFAHALKMAKANAEQSVMIGDNYEADILGAKAYGLKTIFFNYHGEKSALNEDCVFDLLSIKNQL